MSKVIRNKHLKIIELLLQAEAIIERLIHEEKAEECFELLADCQDSAVALGTHIEKLYGTKGTIIAVLEQYCESLYQMSVVLQESLPSTEAFILEGDGDSRQNKLDKLTGYRGESFDRQDKFMHHQQEVILQAEAHLKNKTVQVKETYEKEFPEKLEVVFLPYKAAMWDSLESVWMAARDDENCDAYVIPIPYYDLDGNHNFKEMHYEADFYPDYVTITHYAEYDLEERHPDMIYIHNPYDEYNRVTSIAPEFYSKRIKNFTDKLVYIPYFILNEVNPDNEEAVEDIAHFCKTPAVLNADRVIVQSEQMKKVYVKVLCEWLGENTRQKWEDKILGLGSPKLDKVANIKKEDIEIPKEWLKIIEKSDGSWKKVIFYNTSLNALLKNSDIYFDKVEAVLRIFKESKDDVALLWRPHPLFMQTLESIRTELKDRYVQIVQKYKTEQWGIYDESVDLNRALGISDGYYGDWSSVVQLCQKVKMPVMIQNMEVL